MREREGIEKVKQMLLSQHRRERIERECVGAEVVRERRFVLGMVAEVLCFFADVSRIIMGFPTP